MGKLNVAILRYLSPEDFRVLTAVSIYRPNQKILLCSSIFVNLIVVSL